MQESRLCPISSSVFGPKRYANGEEGKSITQEGQTPPPAHQGGSPRNSSSVRRFLWVNKKESSPSRSAVEPRDTMSKRMGRLKTLRMGGGWGAGALGLCGCFLEGKKGGHQELSLCLPALPGLREAEVGGNETWGTKLKTTMECFTQEGVSWPTLCWAEKERESMQACPSSSPPISPPSI